jgi:5-bromo-4-chloroindolyl phosphate hydrolysis protein
VYSIFSALVGGIGFMIFLFLLHTSMLVASIVGIMGYVGTVLLLGKTEAKETDRQPGLPSNEQAELLITDAQARVKKIRYLGSRIASRSVKGRADAICAAAEKIFDDIRKDPRDVKAAKKFLGYYLDTTASILEKYLDITDKGLQTPEVNQRLHKSEEALEMIRVAFEKQLSRLIENDIIDLDSEISVLQNTLKMEDF